MTSRMGRRTFLRNAALGGTGLMVLGESRSVCTAQANDRLNVGLVGVGGRGRWFVQTIPQLGENVVAMCDVNEQRAGESFAKMPEARKYHDFRKMLEEMDDQIDAVVVATPDHTHAAASVAAMKRGKHVYCEKPLTHNVYESRVMRETAADQGVATQMGNQGTASQAFRRSLELIQEGEIGEIRDVYVWKDSGGPGARQLPQGEQPVPDHLKWDLWLGPAAYRPFHPDWLKWHGWRDFGTGQLGNWATHTANLAFKSLKVDSLWYADPAAGGTPRLTVEAVVSEIDRHSFPKWEMIRWDIPARGELPPVALHYYNGSRAPGARARIEELLERPLDWGDQGEKKWHDHAGLLIVGSEGKLHGNGHNTECTLIRNGQFEGIKDQPQTVPRSPGHEREWLRACRGGEPAMSNFNYGGPLVEFLLLGNVATQFDHAIEYDPIACKIVNSPEANEALSREYREGWSL
ncbi:MAG: Gfo/Idh/MocA family protein [Armatimonadota bacterium]